MADHVGVREARATLSRLLERIERGEEIVIVRAGQAVARLSPIAAPPRRGRLGKSAGQMPSDLALAFGTEP